MATTHSPKTFHIFYAWAEGPWHGRALAAALEQAGFAEAPLQEATIVIAHSVGCYLLSPADVNKIVVLIGPPYWPGKSIVRRGLQKIWQDFRLHQTALPHWLQKTMWNIVYVVSKPSMTVKAWRAVHHPDPLSTLPPHAMTIRNEADSFCTPELARLIKHRVVSLPGQHDDCWEHPAAYVELVKGNYAKLLA